VVTMCAYWFITLLRCVDATIAAPALARRFAAFMTPRYAMRACSPRLAVAPPMFGTYTKSSRHVVLNGRCSPYANRVCGIWWPSLHLKRA